MTKEINRNIRSLKVVQDQLKKINGHFTCHVNDLAMAQCHITSLIVDLEKEYRGLHKAGAYNE